MPIEQEMSLAEWVARLPKHHAAHKEYEERCDAFQKLFLLCEKWKGDGDTLAARMYGNDFLACAKSVNKLLANHGIRQEVTMQKRRKNACQ